MKKAREAGLEKPHRRWFQSVSKDTSISTKNGIGAGGRWPRGIERAVAYIFSFRIAVIPGIGRGPERRDAPERPKRREGPDAARLWHEEGATSPMQMTAGSTGEAQPIAIAALAGLFPVKPSTRFGTMPDVRRCLFALFSDEPEAARVSDAVTSASHPFTSPVAVLETANDDLPARQNRAVGDPTPTRNERHKLIEDIGMAHHHFSGAGRSGRPAPLVREGISERAI